MSHEGTVNDEMNDADENHERRNWGEISMSPQALEHYNAFMRALKDDFVKIEATPLVILVWGPGPEAGGDLFRKREEIRGRLRLKGDVALFSEELESACRVFGVS